MLQIHEFESPPKAFREIVLWSWNDLLTPDELTRQIHLMDQGGWGGFVMHARAGLVTPYLGKQWMAMVRHCIAEAEQRGMQAWLYDEDKWPSGYAGGLVSAAHPEFRAQYLVCSVENRPVLLNERIATFTARRTNGIVTDVAAATLPIVMHEDACILQFYPVRLAPGQLPFTTYTYGDLLNPAAVRSFLDTTYEAYAAQFQSHFGRTVPAVFTDEPCFQMHPVFSAGGKLEIPWTAELPAYFEAQNKYDLLPHLPSLFFEVGDYCKIRFDFWRTVTQLFVESYTRQLATWCAENGIAYAGHYMGEDNLLAQIQWCGAAMPHYAEMHIPGIDKLGRQINTDAGTVLTVKQLDSVACQLGKRRTLCELYGVSGQDFALRGRKWIGDWAYVLGINLSDPHLALYSMRGERKRDCPPNLFFQQPWWEDNRLVADYFARLSYVLSQGQRVVDILVISPIASAWAVYSPASTWAVSRLDEALNKLCMSLMEARRDFHLADEMLIAPGAVAEAQIIHSDTGACLQIGLMAYRVVIIPPGITLSSHTVETLRAFADAGGVTLALEPHPTCIDGAAVSYEVLPSQTQQVTLDVLFDVLAEVLPARIRIHGCPTIWAHQRRLDGCDVYFLANIDQQQGGAVEVSIPDTGTWERWDATTGEVSSLDVDVHDGFSNFTLNFAPHGSHLLVRRSSAAGTTRSTPLPILHQMPLRPDWQVTRADDNALLLDTVQMRIGEDVWSTSMFILDAQASLARGELSEHTPIFWGGTGTPFTLRYTFNVLNVPRSPMSLVVEVPEQFGIAVNGCPLAITLSDWWIDPSFRRFDISPCVRGGQNIIELSGIYDGDMEFEAVYIVGQFGVHAQHLRRENEFNGHLFERYTSNFAITSLPDVICTPADRAELTNNLTAQSLPGLMRDGRTGRLIDLTAQGFPFFAGRLRLGQTVFMTPSAGVRYMLVAQHPYAASLGVYVNGQLAGKLGWEPYEVDVTHLIKKGDNLVEIELANTLRNLLGPHHLVGGDREWTANEHYRSKARWTDDYILVPLGFDGVSLNLYRATEGADHEI
jgi:hypothetical protein